MEFNRNKSIKPLLIAMSLFAVALAAVSFKAYLLHQQLTEAQTKLEGVTQKNLAIKTDIGICTTKLTELDKSSKQPDPEMQELKDQVEAFALQAKSCDALRVKLHVKD